MIISLELDEKESTRRVNLRLDPWPVGHERGESLEPAAGESRDRLRSDFVDLSEDEAIATLPSTSVKRATELEAEEDDEARLLREPDRDDGLRDFDSVTAVYKGQRLSLGAAGETMAYI